MVLDTVKKVFEERIKPLYGDQSNAVKQILERKDRRAELLVDDSNKKLHVGLIVYKKKLQNEFFNNTLELKTLLLVKPERHSRQGYGKMLLDRVTKIAKELNAAGVSVTVSEEMKSSLSFFEKHGFTVKREWQGKYKQNVTEYLLHLPLLRAQQPNQTQFNFNNNNNNNNRNFQPPQNNGFEKRKSRDEYPSQKREKIEAPQSEKKPNYSEVHCHQATLKKTYIHQIRNGSKTIEGRINNGQFFHKKYRTGDKIRFYYQANPGDDVTCKITKIATYNTFKDMLEDIGVSKCLPGVTNLDKGVQIYNDIPGYAEKSNRHGVVAFHLEKV